MSALCAGLLFALLGIDATAAAGTCASLAALALPKTTITAGAPVAAGTYTAPDGEMFTSLPAFCRIAATLTPTSDSNINIEVWMPHSGWNGRFLRPAMPVLQGSLAFFLPLNYAVANTDMGTSPAATQGGRVLTGHPDKQIDFATRSTNLTTVRPKQIIKAFYGEHPLNLALFSSLGSAPPASGHRDTRHGSPTSGDRNIVIVSSGGRR